MATSNRELIELLRGMLYDRGPQANGEIAARAARAVAEHDIDASNYTGVSLNREELATVLAALRHYQNCGYGDPIEREEDIHQIATDGDNLTSLDDEGINELCERLNGGEG